MSKPSATPRRPFPHNDFTALDRMLTDIRGRYRPVLFVVQGVYSQDGDPRPAHTDRAAVRRATAPGSARWGRTRRCRTRNVR
ncbi:hypothetical protein ACFYUD_18040 [Nocardia tengchongensis]|uniref:hypothetical protein n=1 Tax=Nocardia tengchongensis TaxID=2055889 RepID=UPI00368BA886